jgi:hypothetical protein
MKVPQICREYKFAHFCPCRTGVSLSEGFPKPDQHRFVLAEKSIRDLIEEYAIPPALWYLQKTRNPRLASWAIDMSWLWHWGRSNSPTNRQPHHAPVKGAATGNAYIAFVAHDLRRWLLTCRGSATGVISSVPIHPFFSSFILARTPHHAPVKGAATGNANIAFTGSRRLYACVSRSTKYSAKDSGSVTKEAFRVTRSRFCFCA